MRYGIFTGFSKLKRQHLKMMREIGISDAYICLIAKRNFSGMRSVEDTIVSLRTVVDEGLVPHLMYWVFRDSAYIAAMVNHVVQSTKLIYPASILLNCEKDYETGKYDPIQAAAQIRLGLSNYKLGVVRIFDPTPSPAMAAVINVCEYDMPEAYSIWFPQQEPHWSHDKATFPGTMQQNIAEHRVPNKRLVMGLACYFGDRPATTAHPKMSKELTISMSLNETHRQGVHEAVYWSMPHLTRGDKTANETLMCLKSEFQRYKMPV